MLNVNITVAQVDPDFNISTVVTEVHKITLSPTTQFMIYSSSHPTECLGSHHHIASRYWLSLGHVEDATVSLPSLAALNLLDIAHYLIFELIHCDLPQYLPSP